MKSELQYIELYREAGELIKGKSCAVMNAVRDEAFEAFVSSGFPTRKNERYKYTDVDAAFAPNYGISLSPLTVNPSAYIYNIKDAPIDVAPYYHQVADTTDAITALNTDHQRPCCRQAALPHHPGHRGLLPRQCTSGPLRD